MVWARVTISILFIGLLSACSGNKSSDARYGIEPSPARKASANVTDSFSVQNGQLTIQKAAFEKEFLLQAELVDVMSINAFSGQKSRVVYFIERANKVYMLESAIGQVLNKEYDPKLILTSFEIKKEDASSVTIDVNAGLSKVYYGADLYAQDDEGAEFARNTIVKRVNQSYLDQLKLENQNLMIKQVVQFEGAAGSSQLMSNYSVTYYLTPYNPDPKFEPKNNYSFDRFGYFETSPILKPGGETLVRAAKWNLNKPIVYAVSANTPEAFKQAVKDGVLYWNKILGDNHVQVIDAPAGVTAPDFNYNVIQWVDWDDAGMAYADAQMDPRSGEVTHAQVFMTSTFGTFSKSSLRTALRKIKSKSKSSAKSLKMRGFEKSIDCDIASYDQVTQNLETMLSLNLTDDQILKYSQDYVRHIVAHEVGHTLGLRHNFAGSLSANYKASEFNGILEDYLKTDSTTAMPTSSVMDYIDVLETVISGRQIRDGKTFDYDVKAMQHLYFNHDFDNKAVPLFCTDTHVGTYIDCKTFDSGNSVVNNIKTQVQNFVAGLPNSMLEKFIMYKTILSKEEQDSFDIMQVISAPAYWAAVALAPQDLLLKMLKKDFKILSVHRQNTYNSSLNQDETWKAQDKFMAEEIQKEGGLDAVLNPFTQDKEQFVAEMSAKLTDLINSGKYSEGIGEKDRQFKISSAEFDRLKQGSSVFFGKVFDEMKKHQLKSWSHFLTADVRDTQNAQGVADFLTGEAKKILLSKSNKKNYEEILVSSMNLSDGKVPMTKAEEKERAQRLIVTLQLPVFAYSFEQRLLATNLLNVTSPTSSGSDKEVDDEDLVQGHADAAKGKVNPDVVSNSIENVSLAVKEKADLKDTYQKLDRSILWPLEGWHYKMEEQSPTAIKWLIEEQTVKAAL